LSLRYQYRYFKMLHRRLSVSYQKLIDAVTKLVKHNADMTMKVKPVKHLNAVTTVHKTHTNTDYNSRLVYRHLI